MASSTDWVNMTDSVMVLPLSGRGAVTRPYELSYSFGAVASVAQLAPEHLDLSALSMAITTQVNPSGPSVDVSVTFEAQVYSGPAGGLLTPLGPSCSAPTQDFLLLRQGATSLCRDDLLTTIPLGNVAVVVVHADMSDDPLGTPLPAMATVSLSLS